MNANLIVCFTSALLHVIKENDYRNGQSLTFSLHFIWVILLYTFTVVKPHMYSLYSIGPESSTSDSKSEPISLFSSASSAILSNYSYNALKSGFAMIPAAASVLMKNSGSKLNSESGISLSISSGLIFRCFYDWLPFLLCLFPLFYGSFLGSYGEKESSVFNRGRDYTSLRI